MTIPEQECLFGRYPNPKTISQTMEDSTSEW